MTITPDIQSQIDFEHLYNKNQVMVRLKQEFNDNDEVREKILALEKEGKAPEGFLLDLLCQMVLHKRATVDVLVGIFHRHFSEYENPFQAAADALLEAAKEDFVDFEEVFKMNFATMQRVCYPTFILRIDVSLDVYDDLDRYQYPLPMLTVPLEVKTNTDSGYYTFYKSVILRNNHTEDDVYLAHINRQNRVGYSINSEVVRLIQNKWKSLDKQQPGEDKKDFDARVKAFEKYDRTSRDVIDHLLLHGNRFHITTRYDKRGRSYTQGYHVNPQGNPWNKAAIEFAHKEVVRLS